MENLIRSLQVIIDQATGAATVRCALNGYEIKFSPTQAPTPQIARQLAISTWFQTGETSSPATSCAIPLPGHVRKLQRKNAVQTMENRWDKFSNALFIAVIVVCVVGSLVLILLPE